eukprot:jgi/Bigna1/126489/aug1.2_g1197
MSRAVDEDDDDDDVAPAKGSWDGVRGVNVLEKNGKKFQSLSGVDSEITGKGGLGVNEREFSNGLWLTMRSPKKMDKGGSMNVAENETSTQESKVWFPLVGLGTFRLRSKGGDNVVENAVKAALESGYRRIDTASCYRNEVNIGQAIRISKIPREDIFITSKIAPKEMKSFESVRAAVNGILTRIGTSYLDLCLLHWPGISGVDVSSNLHKARRKTAWKALESCYIEGKVRAIGVSNFEIKHLKPLVEGEAKILPCLNQIECHPLFQQRSLREYCKKNDIMVEAYSSFGEGNLLSHPKIKSIARGEESREGGEKKEEANDSTVGRMMTPAALLLKWAYHKGLPVIPKSSSSERISANITAYFKQKKLSPKTITLLDELDCGKKFAWDPRRIA